MTKMDSHDQTSHTLSRTFMGAVPVAIFFDWGSRLLLGEENNVG